MKVYLGADHRGFTLKNELFSFLKAPSHEVEDLGASSLDPNDDYPNFAQKVAAEVAKNEENRGILLCGSGVGVDITANKFDGIRAGLGISAEQIKKAREDDNINILVLAADFININIAKEIAKTFLETNYIKDDKHERRLNQIISLEKSK